MQEGNSFTSSRGQLFSKNLPESIIFWGIYSCIEWRKKWPHTPVLLPGKSHGQRSLVGYSPWGCEESDTTEWLHFRFSLSCVGEGNDNLLQYSCLENPRDRGSWWTAVYGVAQGWTQLKRLSNSSSSNRCVVVSHVVLICISLMISDIEHLNFQCLLAIYTSFLQNLLFKSCAHFWIESFVVVVVEL